MLMLRHARNRLMHTVNSRPSGRAHMPVNWPGRGTVCSSPSNAYVVSTLGCSRQSAGSSLSRNWHHAAWLTGASVLRRLRTTLPALQITLWQCRRLLVYQLNIAHPSWHRNTVLSSIIRCRRVPSLVGRGCVRRAVLSTWPGPGVHAGGLLTACRPRTGASHELCCILCPSHTTRLQAHLLPEM